LNPSSDKRNQLLNSGSLEDAVIEEGRLISVIEEHRKGGFVVYKTIVTS